MVHVGLGSILATAILACGQETIARPPVASASEGPEPTYRYSAIDNGDFAESNADVVDGTGTRRIPWWRSARGLAARTDRDGRPWIELAPGERLEQPMPAYAPLAGTLVVKGTGTPGLRYAVVGGNGVVASGVMPAGASSFTLRVDAAKSAAGASVAPTPRFQLELSAPPDAPASCSAIESTVELPCPTEGALRAELVRRVDEILTTWIERGTDDVGPRKTAILAKDFDAITGTTLFVMGSGRGPAGAGFSSFYQAVFDALEVEENPRWRAYFDRYVTDFFECQLHPDTGLPRGWNPTADVPDDDGPVEIALALDFLIDLAERGPAPTRARAKAAALRVGEIVLAKGRMPDGTCAASYVPRDGTPNLNVNPLRRLDVPTRLVRLSKLTGDARFAVAAREALLTLEFTNHWAGTWSDVDPGFDDNFGHYGARAATAARVKPDEMLFLSFATEGWKHYEPIWRDALRFGGNVAADQVRCWKVGVDLAHLDESWRPGMGSVLRLAARSHFKGEQYGNGAWGDVTIFDYRPNDTLQVGDLPGVPSNLLMGLATIYADEIGLRTDEVRAMFTAVLRSSVAEYGRPYGFLMSRGERRGANSAFGSQRVLPALVEMLRALSVPRSTPPK